MEKRHFALRDVWDTQTQEFHGTSAKRTKVSDSQWKTLPPEEQFLNVVAVWIFGAGWKPKSCTRWVNFNHFPRLTQAICRRRFGLLASMYFDDMTLQDFVSAHGHGDRSMCGQFALVGRPFDRREAKAMAPQQDFCGMFHKLSETFTAGLCLPQTPASASSPSSSSCCGARSRETSYLQRFARTWSGG